MSQETDHIHAEEPFVELDAEDDDLSDIPSAEEVRNELRELKEVDS